MTMRSTIAFAALALVATAGFGTVNASSITVTGGAVDQGDCTFACTPMYEQIYSTSSFPSPVNIAGIDFVTSSYGGTWAAPNSYSLYIGTYSGNIESPSSSFAANITNPVLYETTSFSGNAAPYSLFGFTGSYAYDPAAGDLVIEIINNGSTGGPSLEYNGSSDGVFSRAYSFSLSSTGYINANYGNITVFDTSPVPEPTSLALLGTALLGMARLRRH